MPAASRHALIIEDEMVVGMGVQQILAEIGFDSFAFASTAAQAVEQGRLRRPDLVTADVGLLDGDGVAACRALVEQLGAVPIVYVTGQADTLAGEPGLTVVAKPFGREEMLRACREATANPQTP